MSGSGTLQVVLWRGIWWRCNQEQLCPHLWASWWYYLSHLSTYLFCCWQIFSLRPLSIGTCTSGWELPGVSISFDQYGIGRNLEWFQSPKQNSFWVQGAICREYLCPDWSWWCCVEIMDFGYPQNLSPEILKLYITQEGVGSPFSSKVSPISMMSIHSIFTNGTEMPFL